MAPIAPLAGAYHEHAVWTSVYVAERAQVGSLSRRMDKLRREPPKGDPKARKAWGEVMSFAREAILRFRAGRGLTELLGDSYRWTYAASRWPPATDQEREDFIDAARAAVALDEGSDRRLRRIDSRIRVDPTVTDRRDGEARRLCLVLEGDRLTVDIDLPNATRSIPVPSGFDLQYGSLELWPSIEPSGPKDAWPLFPSPPSVSIRDGQGGWLTVVVHLDRRTYAFRLDSSLSEMKPLFSRRLVERGSSGGTLRFDGTDLVARGLRFDPLGLRELGASEPAPGAVEGLPEGCKRVALGPPGLWLERNHTLIAQRSAGSPRLDALVIPNPDDRSTSFRAAGQDGHAFLRGYKTAWLVVSEGTEAEVARWDTDPTPGRIEVAASKAGGLLAQRLPGSGTRLLLFRMPGEEPQGPLAARFPADPDEISISDAGLVAMREGSWLHLFEPIEELDAARTGLSQQMAAATAPAEPPRFEAKPARRFRKSWWPVAERETGAAVEALFSSDADNLLHLRRALGETKARPTAAYILRREPKLDRGCTEAVAAIFAKDVEAIRSMGRDGIDLAPFPGSKLSLLHLACLLYVPGDFVPALLDLGCDPNARDCFGRTPLYVAAFCEDAGLTLGRLLDHGAKPALCGEVEGVRLGPLGPALYWDEDGKHRVPPDVIERLIEGGADPLAFVNSRERASVLEFAATRPDVDLFRRILDLFRRIDHLDDCINYASEGGSTPLSTAAGTGNLAILQELLAEGAKVDLARPDAYTALCQAVVWGHAECAEALLSSDPGANPDGVADENGQRRNPLDLLIQQSDLAPDKVEKVAEALAKHGADPDADPWPFHPIHDANRDRAIAALRGFAAANRPVRLVETLRRHSTGLGRFDRPALDILLAPPVDLDGAGREGLRLAHLLALRWLPEGEAPGPDPFAVMAERGARLDAPDDMGSTALHYAAAAGRVEPARALLRLAPGLAEARRADGASPADIARLFGQDGWAVELGLPDAPPSRERARAPAAGRMAAMTLLPDGTAWQAAEASGRRFAGRPDAPLPDLSKSWQAALTRTGPLPYASGRRLRETWWRRDDGQCALTAEVVDAGGGVVFGVNGSSLPIHEMNRQEAPALDAAGDALTYLKFFCGAVHGSDGPFAICDSESGMRWHLGRSGERSGDLPDHAPRAWRSDDGKAWSATATVRYGRQLFRAQFQIQPTGMVEMIEDEAVPGVDLAWSFGRDQGFFYYVDAG